MAEDPARKATNAADDTHASDLEDLIGYNLKRAYVIVRADFNKSMGADGMSTRVFTALSLALRNPDITQSALARMMEIERSGLVAIVDELEARDFLHRVAVPTDRRVQALVVTDKGRRAYATALRTVRAHEDRLFETLSDHEKRTLVTLLRKIRHVEDH